MREMIRGTGATDAVFMTSMEVFGRGARRTEVLRLTEGARVSESNFYEGAQSREALLRAFLEDGDAMWLRWFQREINAKFESTKGGLEIFADVLRKWFEDSYVQCSVVNKLISSSHQFDGETYECFEGNRDQLRRLIEQLVAKMDLPYPDIAASAAVQIIERTIVTTLVSGDLSELKTAQLLFQCLQRALSVGFN